MTQTVRIPADVEREDAVLGTLTARQLSLLATAAAVLYGLWSATRSHLPLPVFVLIAFPLGAASVLLALGRRDGLSMDRLMLAAMRQRLAPQHQVNAPGGIQPAPAWLAERATPADAPGAKNSTHSDISPARMSLPAQEITETGVVDLGDDGLVLVAVCGTVNFALRTPAEQEALVGAFGQYLHSLSAPVQILVRAQTLDLSAQIGEVRHNAASLPHPALEAAAREHADYLTQLAESSSLLRRQVLLVLREPLHTLTGTSASGLFTRRSRRSGSHEDEAPQPARRAAEARLVRRLAEAEELLGPLGITVTALDPGQTTAVLGAACNPASPLPPSSEQAAIHEVITASPMTDHGASRHENTEPPELHRPRNPTEASTFADERGDAA